MQQWATGVADAFTGLWQRGLELLPNLASALVVIVVGWVIARLLKLLAQRLVRRLSKIGAVEREVRASGVQEVAPKAVAAVVFWAVFLLFVAAAGQLLGLAVVTGGLSQLASYLPRLLSAVVVVLAGVVFGNLARAAAASTARTARIARADLLGELARLAVFVIAGVIALEQAGIHSTVLVVALALVIGGALGGAALAFGLGARTSVANMVAARTLAQTYRPGQRIRVGAIEGRILQLGARGVLVETNDGRALIPAKLFDETTSVLLEDAA